MKTINSIKVNFDNATGFSKNAKVLKTIKNLSCIEGGDGGDEPVMELSKNYNSSRSNISQ